MPHHVVHPPFAHSVRVFDTEQDHKRIINVLFQWVRLDNWYNEWQRQSLWCVDSFCTLKQRCLSVVVIDRIHLQDLFGRSCTASNFYSVCHASRSTRVHVHVDKTRLDVQRNTCTIGICIPDPHNTEAYHWLWTSVYSVTEWKEDNLLQHTSEAARSVHTYTRCPWVYHKYHIFIKDNVPNVHRCAN